MNKKPKEWTEHLTLALPPASDTSQFTGERFLPSLGGEIEVEHFHRYFFAALFSAGKRVLDVACGEGYGTFMLGQHASSVLGVDVSEQTISQAKAKYKRENCSFIAGDCTAIPVEDESFDMVVSFETIEHIEKQAGFLQEIRRALKPGGLLVISSPEKEEYDHSRLAANPFHKKELSLSEFNEMLSDNFKHVKLLGQYNSFGSFITPPQETNSSFVSFEHQEKSVDTKAIHKATYVLALCSQEKLPEELPSSFYGMQKSEYLVSALQGGIKERDKALRATRLELAEATQAIIEDPQTSGESAAEQTLRKTVDRLQLEKASLTAQFELKLQEQFEMLDSQKEKLEAEHDRCRRQVHCSEARVFAETRERIFAEVTARRLSNSLSDLKMLQELEGHFIPVANRLLSLHTEFISGNKIAGLLLRDRKHAEMLRESGLYDPEYCRRNGAGNSLEEYIATGWQKGKSPHPLFDAAFFKSSNEKAGNTDLHVGNKRLRLRRKQDPLLTFLLQTPAHQNSPHLLFDVDYYLSQIPKSVLAARYPLSHFLAVGVHCGIDPHPLFDCRYYLQTYPDVQASQSNPLVHYVLHGAREGRTPHPCFDPAYYSRQCPESGEMPLWHLLTQPATADPNKLFSNRYYLSQNPDVEKAGIPPLVHFIRHGEKENRNPHPYFEVNFYKQSNPDVEASEQNALNHFLRYGEQEGRIPYSGFDSSFYREWHATDLEARNLPFSHFIRNYGNESNPVKEEELTLLVEQLQRQKQIQGTSPRVSIIIPIFGKLSYTLRCLRSLALHLTQHQFEIIVVDDCSPDASGEALGSLKSIRLIRQPANAGFISSCNLGAAAAQGEFLLFLNNDTEVLPGWLDELVQTFDHHAHAGLVGSKLVYPTGRLQEAGGIIWADGNAWNYGRNADRNHPDFNFLRPADYVSGASILIKKSLFKEVGGFDPEYSPAYAEDVDLAFKVREKGYEVLYNPLSAVVHCEGVSSGTDTAHGIKSYQVSNLKKLFQRWKPEISKHGVLVERPDLEANRGVKGQILFFDATTPTPDKDGGSLLAFYWMKALRSLGYAVTFVPQDNLAYDPYYTPVLQREGIRCLHAPYANSLEDTIKQNPGEISFAIVFRYQVGQATMPFLRQYQPQAKIIFHNVDLHYLRLERQAEIEGNVLKARLANKVKKEELRVHAEAHLIHTLSDFEKTEILRHLPQARVEVSQPIQDCWHSGKGFLERKDICFVGGFRHEPNVDAVLFLVQEVMPWLREHNLGLRLLIIGPGAPRCIRDLECEDVRVIGHVKDLREIFSSIRLSVAPIRYGAGVKTKVSASMGYGVPVVSTPVAVEGMGLTSEKEVLIGSSAREISNQIARLYTNPIIWQALAASGFAYASQNYSIASFTALLKDHLKCLSEV